MMNDRMCRDHMAMERQTKPEKSYYPFTTTEEVERYGTKRST